MGKWLWLLFPSYIDSAHFHVATVWNGWHMLLQSFIPSKEFTLFMDGFNKVQLLWGGKKTKSVEKKLTASDEWSRTLSGPNIANRCLLSLSNGLGPYGEAIGHVQPSESSLNNEPLCRL